jgi:hypothetical protein
MSHAKKINRGDAEDAEEDAERFFCELVVEVWGSGVMDRVFLRVRW